MVDRIRRIQAGNNQIFAILGNYMQNIEEQEAELWVRHFPPPVYQAQMSKNNAKNNPGMNSFSSLNGDSNHYQM